MAGTARDAVHKAVNQVGSAHPDNPPQLSPELRALIDEVLNQKPHSEKPALLFLLSYKLLNPEWALDRVPPGWRPADKVLCDLLTQNSYTLHGRITAYGENLGIKGAADKYDLFERPLLGAVLKALSAEPTLIEGAFAYVAWRFRQSHRDPIHINAPPPDELTFTKAWARAARLLAIDSGGHFPQFLVAALMRAFHDQWETGLQVVTHHPNASDSSDQVAGDVVVRHADGRIVSAFEVSVRSDWKNRRQDLLKKMQRHALDQYHVLCLIPERDPDISTPQDLHTYMAPLQHDISVVDVRSYVTNHLMELTRDARSAAFGHLREYVQDQKLCGVPELETKLKEILESGD